MVVVLVIIIITFMALAAIEFGGDGGNYRRVHADGSLEYEDGTIILDGVFFFPGGVQLCPDGSWYAPRCQRRLRRVADICCAARSSLRAERTMTIARSPAVAMRQARASKPASREADLTTGPGPLREAAQKFGIGCRMFNSTHILFTKWQGGLI